MNTEEKKDYENRIKHFKAMKDMVCYSPYFNALIDKLNNSIEDYTEEFAINIKKALIETFKVDEEQANLISVFFISIFENTQLMQMKKGTVEFLKNLNEIESNTEFEEIIQGLRQNRINYKNSL